MPFDALKHLIFVFLYTSPLNSFFSYICSFWLYMRLPLIQLYVMPSFFLAVMIFGLPLNLLSLWVFFLRLRRWTRSTLLLFNLTLADTSWLLALPFLIQYHLDRLDWRMGLPMCSAVRMLYHNYFYLSIFFVTFISVDRYLAIVHPLRSLVLLGRRQTCVLCVLVWVTSLVLSIPVANMSMIQTCPGSNRSICTLYILLSDTNQSLPFSLFCSITGFLFPLLCICYCGLHSVRELSHRPGPDPLNKQRRLRRVLKAALFLFALFYLPYHLCRNAAIVMRAVYPDNPVSWWPADVAFTLEMCFCSLNTCINPLFSCFIGRQFRREFNALFVLFAPCTGLQVASEISKNTEMTVRKRHGMSTVSPEVPDTRP
uniref:2-oxoglutarate receptor 1-like n=1 Tax=Sphaeramia orbicularis TaxID=375764 RepID=A0A673C9I6_9TELE